jgi:ribosome biogenesis SPOUT family RNA methylase Rps3
MLQVLPPTSHVHFTSLSKTSAESLPTILSSVKSSAHEGGAHLHVSTGNITKLLSANNPPIPVSKVCLLDPKAPKILAPEDGEPGKFEYFLFGGILGDDPPLDRTGALRALGFEGRHLGPVQMTTDTALAVTKRVVEDKGEG